LSELHSVSFSNSSRSRPDERFCEGILLLLAGSVRATPTRYPADRLTRLSLSQASEIHFLFGIQNDPCGLAPFQVVVREQEERLVKGRLAKKPIWGMAREQKFSSASGQ
jgi:hypothetical protein